MIINKAHNDVAKKYLIFNKWFTAPQAEGYVAISLLRALSTEAVISFQKMGQKRIEKDSEG